MWLFLACLYCVVGMWRIWTNIAINIYMFPIWKDLYIIVTFLGGAERRSKGRGVVTSLTDLNSWYHVIIL